MFSGGWTIFLERWLGAPSSRYQQVSVGDGQGRCWRVRRGISPERHPSSILLMARQRYTQKPRKPQKLSPVVGSIAAAYNR